MMATRGGFVGLALALGLISACNQAQLPVSENGAYVILAVDVDTVHRQHLEEVSDLMAEALRTASIRYSGRGIVDDAARVHLVDPADIQRAREALVSLTTVTLTEGDNGAMIEARIADATAQTLAAQTIPEAVGVLERRLSGQRMSVARHGVGYIIVRTASSRFPDELRPVLTTTAQLTFHLVREINSQGALDRAPPGTMVAAPYPHFGQYAEVVQRRPSISGAQLVRAEATFDAQTSSPVLSFQLDGEGTRRFCRVTTEHTGERFAILFDNQVLTAPRINEPICGGSGIISGNFTVESAQELAIVLRAGALPAPLVIIQEGVGPVS